MHAGGQRGLSLIELILVTLLLGVVGSSALAVVTASLRSARRQAAAAQIQTSLRTAVAVVAAELRELGSGPTGGDLIERGLQGITYRAKRSTAFLCHKPDQRVAEVIAWGDPVYGLRPFEAGRDSILVFAENDPRTSADNEWHSAMIEAVIHGNFCPGPSRGVRMRLAGLAWGSLAGVERGAPVRGFQVTRLLLYQDARRTWWLGLREYRAQGGWSVTQPVLGPLAHNGLRFEYLDASGEPVDDSQPVALIGFTVVAQGPHPAAPVIGPGGVMVDSLSTYIALRNRGPVRADPAPQ
ncbi:MAG: hypothetical protein JSW71_23410 [Gemmatimonadota bacterium]|nr:MAG: hypothetical protein JSW71_23410 [Gemmatimonadota bacterium]